MSARRSMTWRRVVARNHAAPWARALAKAGRSYLHAWQNLDYDLDHNGERTVLARLAPRRGEVLVDGGANTGAWAMAAIAHHPTTTVHAFEVVPSTVDLLRRRVRDHPGVVVHDVGLGAVDQEEVRVWVPEDSSRGASLVPAVASRRAGSAVTGRLRRGDDVLAELGAPRVSLLKLDVEGATVAALEGFGDSLVGGLVDAVQFEWNELSIEAGTMLRDHYALLEGAGFTVGRIHPDGAAFAPYRPVEERTAPGNYLAVRRDRVDLVERMRCR